jgi:hypothetical protein
MSCDLEICNSFAAKTEVWRVSGAQSVGCSELTSCVMLHFNNIGLIIIRLLIVSRTSEVMSFRTNCNLF